MKVKQISYDMIRFPNGTRWKFSEPEKLMYEMQTINNFGTGCWASGAIVGTLLTCGVIAGITYYVKEKKSTETKDEEPTTEDY